MDEDEPNFYEMENPIIYETNSTIDNTQKDENLDGLFKDMKSFKEFRDSVESKLHRMEEAIIANSNVQKASLFPGNGVETSSVFVFRERAKTKRYRNIISYKEVGRR